MAREQVIWIDASGEELNLNDWVNFYCPRNRTGIFAPPYTLTSTKLPLSEGSQYKSVTVGERGVDLPILIKASTREDLLLFLRAISFSLDPTRGEGQLKIINGTKTRILYCRPEGIKNIVDKGMIAEFTLGFTANDPYWYDASSNSSTIENISTDIYNFFSDSFFPIRLISSTAYALRTLTNNGDVHTYPTWTITGPGDSINLRNLTTGKNLSFDELTLEVGQVLEIDTRVGIKTIKVDGENQFSKVQAFSSLWSLIPGDNDLVIQMANSSLDSSIQIEFTQRYLAP